nr:MAG TPA: hypothetical protein [Caudoviricetes sp.]
MLSYRHDGEKESEVRKMWVSRRKFGKTIFHF